MKGLFVKLIACPTIVYTSGLIFTQVYFPAWYQPVLLGIVLAVMAHVMEMVLFHPGRVWVMTALDFMGAAVLVYAAGLVFPAASITVIGAVLTALLLAISELIQHMWLVSSEAVRDPIF